MAEITGLLLLWYREGGELWCREEVSYGTDKASAVALSGSAVVLENGSVVVPRGGQLWYLGSVYCGTEISEGFLRCFAVAESVKEGQQRGGGPPRGV